jgi:translation elongation factor EF-4
VSTDLVKLEILLNGVPVEELCNIVHIKKVDLYARDLVSRLKEMIPRQMVKIQPSKQLSATEKTSLSGCMVETSLAG